MFPELFHVNMSKHVFDKCLLKAKIRLKKMYTPLNKYLETVQINQCGKDWSSINFNNVTSCTMRKQSKAFLNVDKKNSQRSSDDDRIQCARNFKAHIEAAKSDSTNHKVRGRRCGVGDLTRDAMSCSIIVQTLIELIFSGKIIVKIIWDWVILFHAAIHLVLWSVII